MGKHEDGLEKMFGHNPVVLTVVTLVAGMLDITTRVLDRTGFADWANTPERVEKRDHKHVDKARRHQ